MARNFSNEHSRFSNKQAKKLISVVIVDDDPDDIVLIKDYLSDMHAINLQISVCQTYQQGWERIAKDQDDVYLIDQHLGVEKGVSLISRARDRGMQKPMILLTGNDSLEVDYEAQEAGATDYVFKGDLKPSVLVRSVRYGLAQWQASENREKYLQERIARKQAEELEQRKSDFLKIASHELKTPIASTLSSLYLLGDEIKKKNCGESEVYLKKMHRQLNHLTSMVEDLLDLSKIEMEELEFRPQVINLSQLVAGVVSDFEQTTKRKIVCLVPKSDVFIQADPPRIIQVVTNLISNANQYTPVDQKIEVSLHPRKEVVEIEVRDHGVGISKADLDKVFDKFFSDRSRAVNYQTGFGLGLFLAKQIIESHGGNITASSQFNKGTTFVVQLPFEQN